MFVVTDPKVLAEALRAARASLPCPERAKRVDAILAVARTGKRSKV